MIYRTEKPANGIYNAQEIEVNESGNMIVRIKWSMGNTTKEVLRSDDYEFSNSISFVFRSMMHNNVSEFVRLLNRIRHSDLLCYRKGKEILEEERKKYELD